MPFVGGGHIWLLLIVLAIVLVIWGPGKLPEIGSGMGRAIREFRKATTDVRDQVTSVGSAPETVAHTDGAGTAPTAH